MLFSRELAFHEGSNTILDKTNFSYFKVNIIHTVFGDQLFDLKHEFILKGKNKSKKQCCQSICNYNDSEKCHECNESL